MASKRNQRRRACERKQRHETHGQAVAHVIALARIGHHGLHAYHCPFGDHWHVGHLRDIDWRAARGKGKE